MCLNKTFCLFDRIVWYTMAKLLFGGYYYTEDLQGLLFGPVHFLIHFNELPRRIESNFEYIPIFQELKIVYFIQAY